MAFDFSQGTPVDTTGAATQTSPTSGAFDFSKGTPVETPKKKGIISRVNDFFSTNPILSGLQKVGEVVEGAATAVTSPLTRIPSTAIATTRGLGALGAYGIAQALGKEEAGWAIMAEEAAAQRRDTAQPKQFRPAQNMLEATGMGLQAGAMALAAPYAAWLSTLPGATAPLVGTVAGGASGLAGGAGAGLEASGTQGLGPLETVEKTTGSSMIGGAAGLAAGYATGKLSETTPKKTPKTEAKAERRAGVITQETGRNLKRAEEGIKVFKPEELKAAETYDDLVKVSDAKIRELKAGVDAEMAKAPNPVPLKTFDKTVPVKGGPPIKTNPVIDALDDLDQLYTKTSNPEALAAVRSLKNKAVAEGLTASEVNDLARRYGMEFKAFNPNTGNPPTTVTKIGYENTRSALKDSARSLLPTEQAKVLDEQMGNVIALRETAADNAEAYQNLLNKVEDRNIVEKVMRGIGQVVDWATFGGPKAFFHKVFLQSNVGLKTTNILDRQGTLLRDLKTVNALLNLPEDKFVKEISKMVEVAMPLITAGVAASQK